MTQDEIALLAFVRRAQPSDLTIIGKTQTNWRTEALAIINAAAAEEREACAAMVGAKAEEMDRRSVDCGCHHDVEDIADAIRARGQASPPSAVCR